MSAYNELYLDDAMNNLGDMLEYAILTCGYEPDEFFSYFITSKIASKFEKGNPKYVVGMSGFELANTVMEITYRKNPCPSPTHTFSKGKEFWSGWILAYYQWITGKRFKDLVQSGLTLSTVMSMYIFHEADVSKFVDAADKIVAASKKSSKTKLQLIRHARGFTQQELSLHSGVTLRMIQLYEQNQNDISNAHANVVLKLAKTLGCDIEDLLN